MATIPKQFIVKTKSNFRNLNGVPINLHKISGTCVTGEIIDTETNKPIKVDFTLKEVQKFI